MRTPASSPAVTFIHLQDMEAKPTCVSVATRAVLSSTLIDFSTKLLREPVPFLHSPFTA
jgi:hypothetical protein